MNVRVRMYQVLLFKFGRHLCKGSIMVYVYKAMLCHTGKKENPTDGAHSWKELYIFPWPDH